MRGVGGWRNRYARLRVNRRSCVALQAVARPVRAGIRPSAGAWHRGGGDVVDGQMTR